MILNLFATFSPDSLTSMLSETSGFINRIEKELDTFKYKKKKETNLTYFLI